MSIENAFRLLREAGKEGQEAEDWLPKVFDISQLINEANAHGYPFTIDEWWEAIACTKKWEQEAKGYQGESINRGNYIPTHHNEIMGLSYVQHLIEKKDNW